MLKRISGCTVWLPFYSVSVQNSNWTMLSNLPHHQCQVVGPSLLFSRTWFQPNGLETQRLVHHWNSCSKWELKTSSTAEHTSQDDRIYINLTVSPLSCRSSLLPANRLQIIALKTLAFSFTSKRLIIWFFALTLGSLDQYRSQSTDMANFLSI